MKSRAILILALAAGLCADTVQLKNGRRAEGTFLGGDTRQVRLLGADGNVQTFDITDIESIGFGKAAAAAAAPAASVSAAPARAASPRAGRVVVPAGTAITVRMIEGVDSDVAGAGEKFRASLDQPLQVGTQTIAPRGADATVQVVRVEQSGKLTGRDEVALDLYDITINGKKYAVASSYAEVQSESRTRGTAVKTGGGAALGAIIGGLAGGGRGAAIGATAGAGAGAASQVFTKGQK